MHHTKVACPTSTLFIRPGRLKKQRIECGVCHGLDRATIRKETKEKWASIVKDMQGRKADWIPDADAAKIVEFLASQHGK